MILSEVLTAGDKMTLVNIKASKKKKTNPKASKTTKLGSFIDMFGGIAGYPGPGDDGSVNATTTY